MFILYKQVFIIFSIDFFFLVDKNNPLYADEITEK